MNGDMVRAVLDGRKTQTRRAVNVSQDMRLHRETDGRHFFHDGCGNGVFFKSNPCGQPGDLLYVRETWWQRGRFSMPMWPEAEPEDAVWSGSKDIIYAADNAAPETHNQLGKIVWLKRPSIHMPRWASRITLEITDVRVERLQKITDADAEAEGAEPVFVLPDGGSWPFYEGFRELWNCIYGTWDANPWVWVIEFKPHLKNVDEVISERA